MTKIFSKILTALTVGLVLTMTGCLKDPDYTNNWIGTKNNGNQNFVEVHLTSSNNSNFVIRAYNSSDLDTTVTKLIPINLTSGPASGDVTVSFELLDTINSPIVDSLVNIEGDPLADTSVFKILNTGMKVTIPAGSSTGYVSVKFKPNTFIGNTYVFGIKLTAVSNKSYTLSNLTTGIVKFGIKNMYDGDYTLTGTFVDYSNANFHGLYPLNVSLITQGGNSVVLYDIDYWGSYFHTFLNGTGVSGYGSFSPVFIFDASNNVTSVVNYYGQPAGNGRSAELDPSGINKYDPATKTLSVSYWMNQPAVISPHRTHFVEVYTFVGPR